MCSSSRAQKAWQAWHVWQGEFLMMIHTSAAQESRQHLVLNRVVSPVARLHRPSLFLSRLVYHAGMVLQYIHMACAYCLHAMYFMVCARRVRRGILCLEGPCVSSGHKALPP